MEKKLYFIRTYSNGYIRVSKRIFDDFVKFNNLHPDIDDDFIYYPSTTYYRFDKICVAYVSCVSN